MEVLKRIEVAYTHLDRHNKSVTNPTANTGNVSGYYQNIDD
jgi:hypothetical protein